MNGPPEKEVGPDATNAEANQQVSNGTTANTNDIRSSRQLPVTAQQMSWWSVHELVSAVLDQANGWPLLGSPAWCSLARDDPHKWAAILDSAQHWALHVKVCQEARAEASRDVSEAVDWQAVTRGTRQRAQSAYIRRAAAQP